jgi:hypothetical protein
VDNNHRSLEGSHSCRPGTAPTSRTPHLLNLSLSTPFKARVGFLQLLYASLVCNAVYYLKNTVNMYALPKVHHHELCSPSKSHHVRRDYRVSDKLDPEVGPWSNKSITKKQTGQVSCISLCTTISSASLWLPGENISQSDDTVDSLGSIVVRNHL